jgi:hypothetical protein
MHQLEIPQQVPLAFTVLIHRYKGKKKGKDIPVTGRGGP